MVMIIFFTKQIQRNTTTLDIPNSVGVSRKAEDSSHTNEKTSMLIRIGCNRYDTV